MAAVLGRCTAPDAKSPRQGTADGSIGVMRAAADRTAARGTASRAGRREPGRRPAEGRRRSVAWRPWIVHDDAPRARAASSLLAPAGRSRECDFRPSARVHAGCGSARLADEWLQVRNELSIAIFCRTPVGVVHPFLPRSNASPTAGSRENRALRFSRASSPACVDAADRSSSIRRCGGWARRPESGHDPLIHRLRQSRPAAQPREGDEGISPENFDTQRERHLQPRSVEDAREKAVFGLA